jgi:hypothetical protein
VHWSIAAPGAVPGYGGAYDQGDRVDIEDEVMICALDCVSKWYKQHISKCQPTAQSAFAVALSYTRRPSSTCGSWHDCTCMLMNIHAVAACSTAAHSCSMLYVTSPHVFQNTHSHAHQAARV